MAGRHVSEIIAPLLPQTQRKNLTPLGKYRD